MAYLKPATALLSLIYVNPFKLSSAEKVRREEVLDFDKSNGVVANLVLDAEFHRAMMKTGIDAHDNDMKRKILQKMRARRAKVAHERSLLAGSRSVSSSGGVNKDSSTTNAEPTDCVPTTTDHGVESDIDVGVLSTTLARHVSSCQGGYICIPVSDSSTGGQCVPVPTPQRILQDQNATEDTEEYCPPGCPTEVCDCFEYEDENPECADVFVSSCKDGSLLNNCYGDTDPVYQANAVTYCALYVCLDDKGLMDPSYDGFCDSINPDCAECFCGFYTTACNAFTPLCDAGSEYGACGNVDYACAFKECCDAYGPDACFIGTDEPTAEPTPIPTSAAALSTSSMIGTVIIGGAVIAPVVVKVLF